MEPSSEVHVEDVENVETKSDKSSFSGEVVEINLDNEPKNVTFDDSVIYEELQTPEKNSALEHFDVSDIEEEEDDHDHDDSDSDDSDSDDSDSDDSDLDSDSDSDDSDSDDSDIESICSDEDKDEVINMDSSKEDKEEEQTFDYGDVMDGSHVSPTQNIDLDEDIGGKSVASIALATSVVGGSLAMKKRNRNIIITGVLITGVVALISYLIWKKMNEMKKEIKRLELQQNMVLNDKDVEVITLDTIEGYIRDQQKKIDQNIVNEQVEPMEPVEQVVESVQQVESVLDPVEQMEPVVEPVEPIEQMEPVVESVEQVVPDKLEKTPSSLDVISEEPIEIDDLSDYKVEDLVKDMDDFSNEIETEPQQVEVDIEVSAEIKNDEQSVFEEKIVETPVKRSRGRPRKTPSS